MFLYTFTKALSSILLSPNCTEYVREILENCLATIEGYVFFGVRLSVVRLFIIFSGGKIIEKNYVISYEYCYVTLYGYGCAMDCFCR